MRVQDVRMLMPDAIVGLSIEHINDVRTVMTQKLDVNYLGISPVFGTATKLDIAPPLGLDGVAQIRALTDLPLVGIGGINLSNAHQVIQAGAEGIAVVSAICSEQRPDEAVKLLLERLK
jgi:thiamine-phosphate pyrophosphorylase